MPCLRGALSQFSHFQFFVIITLYGVVWAGLDVNVPRTMFGHLHHVSVETLLSAEIRGSFHVSLATRNLHTTLLKKWETRSGVWHANKKNTEEPISDTLHTSNPYSNTLAIQHTLVMVWATSALASRAQNKRTLTKSRLTEYIITWGKARRLCTFRDHPRLSSWLFLRNSKWIDR